jgi:lysophospholipase L1-like esterase
VTPRVDYARKSGVRIFAIGASTTEEWLIDDEAIWTHRLQRALSMALGNQVEVINTGVAGARARHHVATLRYISSLQPDIVLFLVGVNDWVYDIYSQFGDDRPPRRVRFADTLLGRTARMQFYNLFGAQAQPQPLIQDIAIPLLGGALGRQRKISWFPEAVSERYLADLREISEMCRANTLTCVFLTQPSAYHEGAPEALKSLLSMTPPDAPYTLTFESLVHVAQVYNRALIDFASKNGHPVCDLAPRIASTTEYFWDDVHFTLAGSARVAELATECIKPLVAAIP